MDYNIIQTGSSGNCVIINKEIAIDMGITMKKLRESGYIKSLKLVLLTHEHGDHFCKSTVRALHKERPALRWGCCEWMVPKLLEASVDKRVIDVCDDGIWQVYTLCDVMPVPTIHDVANCAWRIWFGRKGKNDFRLFYVTDCATLDGIDAKEYDLYMLESNHTRAEIEDRIAEKQARGEFAYETRAARNHLSQEQAVEWLARNAGPNSKVVFLHQHKS